jgi:hypothetical protein
MSKEFQQATTKALVELHAKFDNILSFIMGLKEFMEGGDDEETIEEPMSSFKRAKICPVHPPLNASSSMIVDEESKHE